MGCFLTLSLAPMVHKLALLATTCLLATSVATAQPVAAFVNTQNQFQAWDNGLIRKIDFLPPTDFKVGRTAIPFLDNARNFKIYSGGGVHPINAGFTNTYAVSDNLTIFLNAKSLNVYDNGVVKNLSPLCTEYYLGDSLVLFNDDVRSEYKAYYNGQIYPVENFLASTAIQGVKVSDNIAAYNNYANQFRIFYRGNLIPQEEYTVSSFEAGRNLVGYVDANQMFKLFHDGNTSTLENFQPKAYSVGDNVAAYITTDGYFKIWYADSVYNMGYFTPNYTVGDNVVAYRDASGMFKVFYKGQVIPIDNYYPDNYIVQYNSLAYVSQGHVLRLFTDGEVYDVTTADVSSWDLNYDVLKYTLGPSLYRVYYKGQEY